MARYTVRIELTDAKWDQYVEMYEHLAAQNITDVLTDDKGAKYRMPPAEYNYEGPANRSQVLEMAKAAARKVVKEFRVLVTESNGRVWHNLERI